MTKAREKASAEPESTKGGGHAHLYMKEEGQERTEGTKIKYFIKIISVINHSNNAYEEKKCC